MKPAKFYQIKGLHMKTESDGKATAYYDFPEGAKTIHDLIKHRGMSFEQGEIFLAAYNLGHASDVDDNYDLPEGAETLNDLIEHREMSFGQGNIFKAAYRLGKKVGIDDIYDLNKIIYYANRLLEMKGK
jgi:hypothetical protein